MSHIATPEEVAEAIRQDLKSLGYSIVEAAALMRKSPQSLYNILKGTHRISPQNARAFGDYFNYNYDYLTRGKGQLKYDRASDDFGEVLNLSYQLSPAEKNRLSKRERILNDYMELLATLRFRIDEKGFPLTPIDNLHNPSIPIKPQTMLEGELIARIGFWAIGIMDYINLPRFCEMFEKGDFWKPKEESEDSPNQGWDDPGNG